MKIDYQKILNRNMINVFKDILSIIKKNGFQENHHLYVTFDTTNTKVKISKWLKEKYPNNMTIIIQHEYWNFDITKNYFTIELSFSDIKTKLEIPYDAIISFADPYANFGLRLIPEFDDKEKTISKNYTNKKNHDSKDDNVISFHNYKKD